MVDSVEPFDTTVVLFSQLGRQIPLSFVDLLHRETDLRPGDAVLELGCGSGELAVHLASRGMDVDAVDQSPSMIQAAEASYGTTAVRWHCVPAERFSAPSGRYAAIYAFEAFHLFPEPSALVARLKALLRPRGTLGIGWRLFEWENRCATTVASVFERHGVAFDDWGYWLCPALATWLDDDWTPPTTFTVRVQTCSGVDDIVDFLSSIERASRIERRRIDAFRTDMREAIQRLSDDGRCFVGETRYGLTVARLRSSDGELGTDVGEPPTVVAHHGSLRRPVAFGGPARGQAR